MKGNRRRDTKPELAVRSALHRLGLRFRCDYPIELEGRRPVRPDVVFTRVKVAVFIDGCYWHACPEHGTSPKSNPSYWAAKLARNVKRDRQTDGALAERGWTVIRAWEHEPIESAAARVASAVEEAQITVR